MVAYSFQRRFIDPIVTGSKCQTIRAEGARRHAMPGKVLQLYFGMRTKYCRKIIPDQVCVRCDSVLLDFGPVRSVVIGGRTKLYSVGDLDRFAVCDGFENWEDLVAFWAQFHPDVVEFYGVMPGWRKGFWE